jgi:hypothetical protein
MWWESLVRRATARREIRGRFCFSPVFHLTIGARLLCCVSREAADSAGAECSSEFIRTQFSVIGYPLMGRAEFPAVPGWERLIFDSLVSDFKKGTHDV